jgi:hypothetical protein
VYFQERASVRFHNGGAVRPEIAVVSAFSVRRQDISNTRRQDIGNTLVMPVGAVGNAFFAFSKDLVGAFLASTGPGVPSMFDSLEVKVLCLGLVG